MRLLEEEEVEEEEEAVEEEVELQQDQVAVQDLEIYSGTFIRDMPITC